MLIKRIKIWGVCHSTQWFTIRPPMKSFLRSYIPDNVHLINNLTLLFLVLPHHCSVELCCICCICVSMSSLSIARWVDLSLTYFFYTSVFASLSVNWLSCWAPPICVSKCQLLFSLLLRCSLLQHCRKYPTCTIIFQELFSYLKGSKLNYIKFHLNRLNCCLLVSSFIFLFQLSNRAKSIPNHTSHGGCCLSVGCSL